jgi:short-subunit dehydrogenase
MARRKLAGKCVLLTGASSGIGRALAVELGRRGCRLLVTARREERLEQLVADIRTTGGEADYLVGDLCEPLHRQALLREVKAKWNRLDVLINNAGVGAIGPFAEADESRLRKVLEVNFFAPADLIRSALPLLSQGQQAIIVNVSSVLGHRAVPKKSEYCASKFALHGLSDALRAELRGQGIDVLIVSPSTTSSEFFDNVLEDKAPLPWRKIPGDTPEKVARQAARAIAAGRHEIILSPGGKALVWFDRLCPPLVNRLVARLG